MIKPKVVLLIFVSGKIVITGAKVREEIYMAFNQIYTVLAGESSLVVLMNAFGDLGLNACLAVGMWQSSRRNKCATGTTSGPPFPS